MHKHRMALFSGLSLFLCFCLLSGMGWLAGQFTGRTLLIAMTGAEILAFALPILLLRLGCTREQTICMRSFLKISKPSVIGFTFFAALAVSILTFLTDYAFLRTDAVAPASMMDIMHELPITGGRTAVLLAGAFIFLPAILEELFVRGALFSTYERYIGTGACIVVSAIFFAMLHGTLSNFIGPLLGGLLYAYMTYSFDCIWPAVVAHCINNLYYVLILWLTNTYNAFGIWKYFPSVSGIFFLICTYLAFCMLENLLASGHIRRFSKPDTTEHGLLAIIINPGFTVFALAFAAKAIFKLY